MIKFADSIVLLLYCGLIYWLSDQPSLPIPMLFPFQDKLHHFTAYFIMGTLAWRSFRHYPAIGQYLAIISIVFCSLYGITDEWHQSFVEGRTADAIDWLADTLGAGVAVFLIPYLANRLTFSKFRGKIL